MEWQQWRNEFGSDWLSQRHDPHPWGLLAITADKMGDENTAACWLASSEHLRYSENWNILEEAAYQSLKAKLGEAQLDARACQAYPSEDLKHGAPGAEATAWR